MTQPKTTPPAPKVGDTRIEPHPKPSDPAHEEWRVDEAEDESFPASDASSAAQPHPTPAKKPG